MRSSLVSSETIRRPGAPRSVALLAPPHGRRLLSAFLLLLVGANAAILVVLWLQGGGITAVHDLGGALMSSGRITGLLGAYLLLLQALLLARLTFLEHIVGFDKLTIWHRINGKACLYLVLAHVVLITLGYTLTDRISLGEEITALLQSYPGMVTATVGTAFIILVVLTSLVIVRKRLRYETWYLVHLLAYAGIVLTWFHEIPTGNELVTNATAAAYWTALYLVTLGLLILFRFARPLLDNVRYRLRVAEVTVEGPGVVSLHLTGRHLDRLRIQPGQFFLWRFLTVRSWWETHPFSVSAVPDGRSLRITVKALGDFSRRVGEIRPGTRVAIEGPFGTFTAGVQRRSKAVLIAGGIGITPIRPLLETLNGELTLIYRVAREEDIIFQEELFRLETARGVRVIYVTGDRMTPEGALQLSSNHLKELVPDIAACDVYICGPTALAEHIEKSARQAGVPRSAIHFERFALT